MVIFPPTLDRRRTRRIYWSLSLVARGEVSGSLRTLKTSNPMNTWSVNSTCLG